ncbi:hypothetical protein AJ80_01469 [Polytolypa hystricis UAMH7299]|uniref:Uncharacterized protein n=1 Tax=Polytolypa hystricis (strain UAMH7299) TaxID=1447883 RepID=A0A2B7Z219_POLH7|nr:hypothetical protein AJ80_01469 [Polytolypa hystricis UAMH7299]
MLLVDDRTDVNFRDTNGRTPLSWAAENGDPKAVEMFLAKDDIERDIEDNDGHTPLWWAERMGYTEVVRIISGA